MALLLLVFDSAHPEGPGEQPAFGCGVLIFGEGLAFLGWGWSFPSKQCSI